MLTTRWLSVGIVLLLVSVVTLGPGYWVYARQHMGHEEGSMMNGGRSGHMMGNGPHQGMMRMPMMHPDMSPEEMNQFCGRMQQRHGAMQTMRRKNTEKLNSLVRSMRRARGTDKIESMEKVLVELVEQHNRRGRMMMQANRSMMGTMMNMHRMGPERRRMMMQRMQDCPMMRGMMDSGHTSESDGGPRGKHHHQ